MLKAKKREKKVVYKEIGFYFALVYSILTIALIIQLFIGNLLPFKYLIPIDVLLFLLATILAFLQLNRKISKVNKILGKILIILLSVILAIGNWYMFATNSAFSKISSESKQTSVISIIVKKDSSFKKIMDLKSKTMLYSDVMSDDLTSKAIKDIKKDISNDITISSCESNKELVDSLLENSTDSIILDESTISMIEELYENFSQDTRIIKSYKYETKTKKISKDVNVTTDSFNVYITGLDTYGSIASTSRSDVNMLVSIDPKTRQILLISIPRDYYIPQTCQNNQKDKLTHTGIYGVGCTVDSAEKFLNIDINYYLRVNFSSLIDIVDSLGGITVNNQVAFEGNFSTYFPTGDIQLNGEKTLEFSRERYSFAGGDRDRGKNQMRVIEAIISKAISPSIITNYTSVLNAISGSFQTNMSNNDMSSLIKMQLNDMSGWTISQYALDGTGETNWSPANGFDSYVMQPDMTTVNKAIDLINKLHNDEDISGQV